MEELKKRLQLPLNVIMMEVESDKQDLQKKQETICEKQENRIESRKAIGLPRYSYS